LERAQNVQNLCQQVVFAAKKSGHRGHSQDRAGEATMRSRKRNVVRRASSKANEPATSAPAQWLGSFSASYNASAPNKIIMWLVERSLALLSSQHLRSVTDPVEQVMVAGPR